MDYRTSGPLASAIVTAAAAVVFTLFAFSATTGLAGVASMAAAGAVFVFMQEARRRTARAADNALYRRLTVAGASGLVSAFTGRIRTCFTMQEFVSAVRETLELSLDASVLLIRSNTWEQLYASPAALTSDPGLVPVLKRNYRELSEGFVFMDERYNLTVSNKNARGFFVFCKEIGRASCRERV